jgi:hypothetical protein
MNYYVTVMDSVLYFIMNFKSYSIDSDSSSLSSDDKKTNLGDSFSTVSSDDASIESEEASAPSPIESLDENNTWMETASNLSFFPSGSEFNVTVPTFGRKAILLSSVVVYHIRVENVYTRNVSKIAKRYSDFASFDRRVRLHLSVRNTGRRDAKVILPELPPKYLWNNLSNEFLEERRIKLEKYLRDMMSINDVFQSHLAIRFLKLERWK